MNHSLRLENSLAGIVLKIGAVIFGVEAVVMYGMYFVHGVSPLMEALLDASCLTLVAAPILYYFIIRPLRRQLFQGVQSFEVQAIELQEARQIAEASCKAKSEFLANMSHELRTPMTAILGYADVLLEESWGRPNSMEAVSIIHRNGQQLLELINDILDLSKIEAGKLTIEKIPCSPLQLVADVQSLMKARASEKGLRFEVQFQGRIPQTIHSDPTRVRQILINLVANAIKFTHEGSIRLVVQLQELAESEAALKFEVLDTGIGMSSEQTKNLFQAFAQADTTTTRKYGGTGLGLSISRRLVECLGGSISAESTLGVGSAFRVILPTGSLAGVPLQVCPNTMESFPDRQPLEEPLKVVHSSTILANTRILLAEDGLDNQRLVSHVLRKAGAEVTVVENGKLAVDAAIAAQEASQQFDLILMDMQMPEMDGYTATRVLRQMGYDLPIVALTANAMTGDREKCLQAGANDYATKPIDRKLLLQTLADNLKPQIAAC